MRSAIRAASSPTPDKNEEFILDSHGRPKKYTPGTGATPSSCVGIPVASRTGNWIQLKSKAYPVAQMTELSPVSRVSSCRMGAAMVTKLGTCSQFPGQVHVVVRYVLIHQIQKGIVGRVPISDALSEIVCEFQNSPTPGPQSAKKCDPLLDEYTIIDGMAAVGTGDQR